LEVFYMATSTGAFFAGIGTTFAVLALGFGGGLMMANSALNEPTGYRASVARDAPTPVRVILPTTAEAAQPPQQPQQQASSQPDFPPALQPAKEAQAPVEKQFEKADNKKAEERERKRRYAERKAKRLTEARARQQRQQQPPREPEDAPILAFGGDSAPRLSGNFFGN
jgi:hypothetical protein